MEYVRRVYDTQLAERLESAGAVLIRGVKGCGKTETAQQIARSSTNLLLETDARIAAFSLEQVLQGAKPRLIDEWQEFPKIWDSVKVSLDDSRLKGQYILTGSATPHDDARIHSGVGRFSVLTMYPMTWIEKGFSCGLNSVTEVFRDGTVQFEEASITLAEISEKIILGGWPQLLFSTQNEAVQFLQDYLSLICEVDVNRVGTDTTRRDPVKVRRLLESYARNISTEASYTTLARDVAGDRDMNSETVAEYLDALSRLMIVDFLPAFRPHVTSKRALRSTPVKHFVDASLAVGALRLNVDTLVADPLYLGLLFESCVVQNIRAALSNTGAVFSHYRDSRGKEIDLIVELPGGYWCAVEIKLGFGQVEEAAQNLINFSESIDGSLTPKPKHLIVITGNGFAHQREDGVIVIPFTSLGRL
jgi:predicted AAA+ superfamily ATPase